MILFHCFEDCCIDFHYLLQSQSVIFGLVIYHAADCLPSPSSDSHGPFYNPNKFLASLDSIE